MDANPAATPSSAAAEPQAEHPGLEDLMSYPLMAALQDRRTRRVAQGVSLQAGEISYESPNPPSPLSPLEEAVLISATGVVGSVMHDGPLIKPTGAKELGSPFLNTVARVASSADNAQATSVFMINDEGIWLLQRLKGRDAIELGKSIPPRWEDRTEEDWLASAAAVKQKVHDGRVDFPREWPYYLGWNAQHSNVPGTTLFLPVVDNTRQYINALLILASEPKGKAPLFIDDFSRFRPKNALDWMGWAAAAVGLAAPIPYHPIGGVKRIREGHFSKDVPLAMNAIHTARTDHESFLILQNLLLTGEGLRLGGWIHSAVLPPHILRRDPSKQHYGLGFREATEKTWGRFTRWPPAPASQANFVGIDGVLEGLCPPYRTDMDAAVEQVLEEKYGPHGAYGDKETFARAYRDQATADTYLRLQQPHPPKAVEYTKEVCRYLYETYGRFPAHTDSFYLPGLWAQFSHLDLGYYERFANPNHFRRQAERPTIWGN